jgi:hypothetical protein
LKVTVGATLVHVTDAVSAKFRVVVPPAVTVTDALPPVNPVAEAVAVKVPALTVMV